MVSNTVCSNSRSSLAASHGPLARHVFGIFLTAVLTFFVVDSVDAAETVNINTADISTLAAELVGVGHQLARRIVEFRERYGDFETVEALKDVQGIGEALLARNADKIALQ